MTDVSCPSTEVCTAVGHYSKGILESGVFAERWNGKEWSIQTVPTPKGGREGALNGVSCPSTEACIAVGGYISEANKSTLLAERWDGKEWSIQTVPTPKGMISGTLTSVSCLSIEVCTAVGQYANEAGTIVTLAERWDGKEWTIETTANSSEGETNALSGVSCASSEACVAVGRTEPPQISLAETWNGATWSLSAVPKPIESTSGVSCQSTSLCFGVGTVKNGAEYMAMLRAWNGTTWSNVPAEVGEARSSALHGVACPPTGPTCTAVGRLINTSGTVVTLAGKGSAGEWSQETTPNPAGAKSSELDGVSCPSTEACTAVGKYRNEAGTVVTLAERWNGKEWVIQTTPNPAGAKRSELTSVSCPSTEACTAVGQYVNEAGTVVTLAERWNGKEWVIQTTPNPAGAKLFSELTSVSCPSTEACTAVGKYRNEAGTVVTLAERWNGKEWVIQTTPNPAGGKFNELNGVSCPSTEACTAVGQYASEGGPIVTLAERWNGKEWTIETTPNSSEGEASLLSGVSCTSTEACMAVGKTQKPEVSLAEIFN